MSEQKYIKQTLTLPEEIPLFNYNVNFEGLRNLLDRINIKANDNEESIKKIQEQLSNKVPSMSYEDNNKKLSNSFLFGVHSQAYLDQSQKSVSESHRISPKDFSHTQKFCLKINKMAELIEHLVIKTQQNSVKISSDDKKNEKMINESFKRMDDKLNSGIESFSKTINTYFTQSNEKSSQLESDLNMLQHNCEGKFEGISEEMQKRVSDSTLKGLMNAQQENIRKKMENQLKNDHMARLALMNELKTNLKQTEKDMELRNKVMGNKVQQINEKIAKTLSTQNFEMQRHKIFERLSQFKNKIDQLSRKNTQFLEFRKSYLVGSEKTKQQIVGLEEQIKKLNSKESSFKRMENVSDLLESLDPHLICQIGEQVKLHEKQIGKLEKLVIALQNDTKSGKSIEKPMPQVNGGQTSDLIQKIIKQYMSNLDFEGRMKRSEKDIGQIKKKNDTFAQIQKKIYSLSKQIDVGAINKQLRKKCDEENTRRDVKILDGKIEQLFEFYKQVRRQIEEKKRTTSKNDLFENASLTTKKLVSQNCISCAPTNSRKMYSRSAKTKNNDMSLDYGFNHQKSTIYSRIQK